MNTHDSGIPSQIQLYEPPGERPYLVYYKDVSKTNQGVLLATLRSQKKHTSMQTWKIHPDVLLGCTSSTIVNVPWIDQPRHFTSLHWPD